MVTVGNSSGHHCNEDDAASYLGVSKRTLQRWRWSGHGPIFCKFGRAVRYYLPDLKAFAAAGRRSSTSAS